MNLKKTLGLLVSSAVMAFGVPLASAATIIVDQVIDDSIHVTNCSLREAIISANANAPISQCVVGDPDNVATDVIVFDASTNVGNSGPLILDLGGAGEDVGQTGDLDITSNIIIQGNGQGVTVIDASGLSDRVFHNVSGGTVSISGMTIMDADSGAENGGTILLDDGDVELDSVTVEGGVTTGIGAGVYFVGTSLTIIDSIFDGNIGGLNAGGIYISTGGTAEISSSVIEGNGATHGAGILVSSGEVTISDTTIQQNIATSTGGGVRINGGGDVIIDTGSVIFDNDAATGAGLYIQNGLLTIDDVTFEMNEATVNGGGVATDGTSTVEILNGTLFDNNSAASAGGAISNEGTLTISDATFDANGATASGGALYSEGVAGVVDILRSTFVGNDSGFGLIHANDDSVIDITNSTLSANTSNNTGVALRTGSTAAPAINVMSSTIAGSTTGDAVFSDGGTISFANSILDNSTDCDLTGAGTVVSNNYNLESGTSCGFTETDDLQNTDPLLIAISLNAPGTTETHALAANSPAVNAGNTSLLTDQRGATRPNGIADDIGAFEFDVLPVLAEVTPVPSPGNLVTPSYTFSSNDVGTITYGGDCSSSTTSATIGNNTVQFNQLSAGPHANCTIQVTDPDGNASNVLNVTGFFILGDTSGSGSGSTTSGGGGGGNGYFGQCVHFTCMGDGGSSGGETTTTNTTATTTEPTGTEDVSEEGDSEDDEFPNRCAGFIDVLPSDPDCPAIAYARSIGAFTGYPDGSFKPNVFMQGDHMVKVTLEAFDLFESAVDYCSDGVSFADLTFYDWSRMYACRAKELGLVSGTVMPDGVMFFMPGEKIELVEFWSMILKNLNVGLDPGPSFDGFASDEWYSGYAKYVFDNNFHVGAPPSPDAFVPRRDVAAFLFGLHNAGLL